MTASEVIRMLGLTPMPREGGYYREIYRSKNKIPLDALPPHCTAERSYGTAIYYLLTPDTFSHMHKLGFDEIFHFYLGDPVIMLKLNPDRSSNVVTLGQDIAGGQQVQAVVPADTWQGMRLAGDGEWALLGTTVAPGFEFEDYRHGNRDELLSLYPDQSELISKLTG
jgi:predicted cupin superfamily sugar epimerase